MSHRERFPLISAASHPELAPLIDKVRDQRGGQFLNLYAALAHSAPLCVAWLELFTQIRQHATLPARLRELAMLRVAVLNRAPYEFAAHTPFALTAGLNHAQLSALKQSPINMELFEPFDEIVLHYTDAMTLSVQVDEACYQRVRAAFDDRALLELTVTIAGYNMVSRVLEALQIPHDD